MTESGISTVPRFLFLNTFAILLFLGGIGFVSVPFIYFNWWICALCVSGGLFCWNRSLKIFRSWKDKKRKYSILMRRNTPRLIPSSFKDYLQAPCGRLLVVLVLKDLGRLREYPHLLKNFREPLSNRLRESCVKQPTVVRVYEQSSHHLK